MHAYVVGNIATDETLFVDQLPQAGASIFGRVVSNDLGGKGANQALVMARAGLATTLIAPVGRDARAQAIRALLMPEPLVVELIEIDGVASDLSVIFRLPDGENAIVTTTEAAEGLRLADVVPVLGAAMAGDLLVLQGNLSEETTRALLRHARDLGMVTAFNPSPLRQFFTELWDLIDMACLNRGEALALTGKTGPAAAAHLLERGVRDVVLTAGRDGALLSNARDTIVVPSVLSKVVDTTGAGDSFLAVALASSAQRGTRIDRRAIEHAVRAAAITVSRPGTRSAFPTVAELQALLV